MVEGLEGILPNPDVHELIQLERDALIKIPDTKLSRFISRKEKKEDRFKALLFNNALNKRDYAYFSDVLKELGPQVDQVYSSPPSEVILAIPLSVSETLEIDSVTKYNVKNRSSDILSSNFTSSPIFEYSIQAHQGDAKTSFRFQRTELDFDIRGSIEVLINTRKLIHVPQSKFPTSLHERVHALRKYYDEIRTEILGENLDTWNFLGYVTVDDDIFRKTYSGSILLPNKDGERKLLYQGEFKTSGPFPLTKIPVPTDLTPYRENYSE
ncbi:MAG: hypothetical protein ACMXYK_01990 [Candidatus Woesearchaeota archaeon]